MLWTQVDRALGGAEETVNHGPLASYEYSCVGALATVVGSRSDPTDAESQHRRQDQELMLCL